VVENIAIIITRLSGGGAERVAFNLSLELSGHYNVTIIVFDGSGKIYPHGGELIDLKLPLKHSIAKKIINMILRISRLRKIKKEKNIQCSISLLDGPNIVNILSRRKDKVVTSIRNLRSAELGDRLGKGKLKTWLITGFSDKVVVLSKLVMDDLVRCYGTKREKLNLIYNSCDREKLYKKSEANNSVENIAETNGESIDFVTMGRLVSQKGQWHLFRAFKKVLSHIPGVKLYLIGDGILYKKLNILAEELQIRENIIITGFLSNPHMVLDRCDIFVFSSVYEGLGNSILEAMALGKPIISTDCDAGPREILAPDTEVSSKTNSIEYAKYGILVPALDSGQFNSKDALTNEENILAEAMILLASDDELRQKYSSMALERIKYFSSENITSQWKKLIDSMSDQSQIRK
jgi:glycosyltransferase involved in cell wall biosynthesis